MQNNNIQKHYSKCKKQQATKICSYKHVQMINITLLLLMIKMPPTIISYKNKIPTKTRLYISLNYGHMNLSSQCIHTFFFLPLMNASENKK